ncbi:hypothetical protein ANCDUO_11165, partial [Ancylostoma duodenale]
KAAAHTTKSRSPLKNRISRPAVVEVDSDGENTYNAEVVVGDKSRTRSSSPQITVTLKGAKEHIGSLGQSKRGTLKRRKEKDDGVISLTAPSVHVVFTFILRADLIGTALIQAVLTLMDE